MGTKFAIKEIIKYLNDQSVDIRIRMMYFLEYASLIACFIGTIFMILLHQPVESMVPNMVLFVMSFFSIYISHSKKKYDLSTLIMVIGCANIAVPWMFFSAGGNYSGMPLWMMFSVIVACMMLNGSIRFVMVALTILEDLACIVVGYMKPEVVTPLVGENAVFSDVVQSYAVVCVCLTVMLAIYISTYDNQRKQLETIMLADALTGMYNRRAYYEAINSISKNGKDSNLVLVAMDVNGLKKVNDVLGHSAGDDYIREAANVMEKALGKYGRIYRIGGDEFTAVLHCSNNVANSFEEKIAEVIKDADTAWSDKLSIAVGVVCCGEHSDMAIDELEKLADERMYANKSAYYKKTGIDRRK